MDICTQKYLPTENEHAGFYHVFNTTVLQVEEPSTASFQIMTFRLMVDYIWLLTAVRIIKTCFKLSVFPPYTVSRRTDCHELLCSALGSGSSLFS